MKTQIISLKYGSITGLALVGYFLLLSLFQLHIQPIFSVLNLFITGTGMFLAIKKHKALQGEGFKYQHGAKVGLITGFTATIFYIIFFSLYITELNPDFIEEFITIWKIDWFVNAGMLILTAFLMGLATTVILTLTFMQLFKNTWNTKEGRKHMLSKDEGTSENY